MMLPMKQSGKRTSFLSVFCHLKRSTELKYYHNSNYTVLIISSYLNNNNSLIQDNPRKC